MNEGLLPAIVVPLIIVPMVGGYTLKLFFELNMVEEKLRAVSIRDDLTTAYNRSYLIDLAEAELARSKRYGHGFSVIILDIDNFKKINDSYGHLAGDRVLIALASTCQRLIREVDTFARFGGEEFIFLIPNTSTEGAWVLAERVRKELNTLRVPFDEEMLTITVSLGVRSYFPGCPNLDTILRDADRALYAAKARGKDRVVSADFEIGTV